MRDLDPRLAQIALKRARVGVFFIREDHVAVDESYLDLFGLTPEEVPRDREKLAMWFIEMVHPSDREDFIAVNEAIASGQLKESDTQFRVIKPGSGAVMWLRGIVRAEGDALLGTVQDITDIKNAELARDRANKSFRSLFEHMPIGLLLARLEEPDNPGSFRFIWGNAAALVHTPPQEVIGHRVDESFPAILESGLGELYIAALRTGRPQHGPCVQLEQRNGDPAFFDVRTIAVAEDTIAVLYQDVTVRERQLHDLRTLNIDLQRSNGELERFAYVASHDLKAPLRTIGSFIEALVEDCGDVISDDGHEYIEFIRGAVSRLEGLIKSLLELAAVGSQPRREAVDLRRLVDELRRDLVTNLHDSGGELVHRGLPTVSGNPAQLRQLFQNLIANSLKFRGSAPPRIEIATRHAEGHVLIEVRDNGIGIEPEHAQKVFDLFQRLHAKNSYEGTGIGLSVCKKIVEAHGGSIWVDPTPTPGTTFVIRLPAPDESQSPPS